MHFASGPGMYMYICVNLMYRFSFVTNRTQKSKHFTNSHIANRMGQERQHYLGSCMESLIPRLFLQLDSSLAG